MTNDEARELATELRNIFAEAQKGIDEVLRRFNELELKYSGDAADESDIGKLVEVTDDPEKGWLPRELVNINVGQIYPYESRHMAWKYARRIPAAKPAPPRDITPTQQHVGKLVMVRDCTDEAWNPLVLHSMQESLAFAYFAGGVNDDKANCGAWRYARLPYPGEIEALIPAESRETHHA